MKKILLILITLTSFIPIITKRNDYIDVTKVIYINSICLDINVIISFSNNRNKRG